MEFFSYSDIVTQLLLQFCSLFGTCKRKNKRKANLHTNMSRTEEHVVCLSKNDLEHIKDTTREQKCPSNSSNAMMGGLVILSNDESNSSLYQKEEQVQERARIRKEYMIRLEMERQERASKNDSKIKDIGQEQIDPNEDIVKLLNSCKKRAVAFAIRDKQLEDKKIKEAQEREYERMMDIEMEVNRLRDIETREKQEKEKIQKRIADRKIIEVQIQERKHQKLLEEEARDQENRKMLEAVKRYDEEEAAKELQRREDAKKAKLEILERNKEILAEREAQKALEKEEEAMIMTYLAERDEKLRKLEEEEEKEKQAKMALQKKLLESQTKVLDKRSEMDELRARRAAEEMERKHRHRELMEAQKRKRDADLISQSRQEQEEERRLAKLREKEEVYTEYLNAMEHASQMAERERREAAMAEKKKKELRLMLKRQIDENELKRKLHTKDTYSEGLEYQNKLVCYILMMKLYMCIRIYLSKMYMCIILTRTRGKSISTGSGS